MSANDAKAKSIANLINQLSKVAADGASTQDAIQKIVEGIQDNGDAAPMDDAQDLVDVEDGGTLVEDAIVNRQTRVLEEFSNQLKVMEGWTKKEDEDADKRRKLWQLVFTRIREVKRPCKAHPTDAGIDFFVPDAKAWTDEWKKMVVDFSHNPDGLDLEFGAGGILVPPHAHVAIPSGIKTMIPQGLAMMMVNKSGVATKLKLDHSACLIDSEYRDELIFCFFNHGTKVVIEPGMKITQGLIVPVINLELQEVLNCVYDDMGNSSDRGGGFGSSGSH